MFPTFASTRSVTHSRKPEDARRYHAFNEYWQKCNHQITVLGAQAICSTEKPSLVADIRKMFRHIT